MYDGTLTAEHLQIVDEVRADAVAAALATGPLDHDEVEAAILRVYDLLGRDRPTIQWVGSPRDQLGGQLWGQLWGQLGVQLGGPLGGQLRDQLWDQLWVQLGVQLGGQLRVQLWDQLGVQLRDRLGVQLGGQLRARLGAQLGDQLWTQLWTKLRTELGVQLGDQLWDQLAAELRDQLRDQLGDQLAAELRAQLGDQLGEQLWEQLRGQLWDQLWDQVGPWADAYWLTLREAACRVTGLDGPLVTLLRAVRAATVTTWAPYTDAVIICERPTILHVDQQGRLHADDGPALHYADGWAIWSWHGTTVPADLITPGWDPHRILNEPNLEIRRAAIERLGWPDFTDQAGLTLVATAPDPANPGCDLHLYDVPEQVYGAHVRVLVCDNATRERDGTRRTYGLTVPADIKDPVHAAAWTFNLPASTYRELARAT